MLDEDAFEFTSQLGADMSFDFASLYPTVMRDLTSIKVEDKDDPFINTIEDLYE